MAKDYYKILGVAENATQEEVKKAFYKQAHQHHPDKAGGDEKKFKEINEAYQILGNPERRKQYDQFGSAAFEQGGAGGPGGFHWEDFARQGGMQFDFGDLGDLFGQAFGFGGRTSQGRGGPRRGNDIEVELQIDFLEAIFGAEKNIHLYKTVSCEHCHGNGAEPGSEIKTCSECSGTGQVKKIQRTILGSIQTASACGTCKGEGKLITKPCTKCSGTGHRKQDQEILVSVPAGIDDGRVIKMERAGEAGHRNGPAGDLYMGVRVRPHARFERDRDDILTEEAITFPQAALGDKIDVETVDGVVKLKIPEGTQSGKQFRIRGRGVPHLHSMGRGDHIATIVVKTPTNLSRKQKKILSDFDAE